MNVFTSREQKHWGARRARRASTPNVRPRPLGMYMGQYMGEYMGQYVGTPTLGGLGDDEGFDLSASLNDSGYVAPTIDEPNVYLPTVTEAGPTTTTFNDIASAIAAGAGAITTVANSYDLIQVNNARAKYGLPPLTQNAITGVTTASVSGSISPMLLYGGLGLLALLLIMKSRKS